MLIRRGANLEIKNKNGENVLFKSRFRINTFKLIINEGADIECQNKHGITIFYDVCTNFLKD